MLPAYAGRRVGAWRGAAVELTRRWRPLALANMTWRAWLVLGITLGISLASTLRHSAPARRCGDASKRRVALGARRAAFGSRLHWRCRATWPGGQAHTRAADGDGFALAKHLPAAYPLPFRRGVMPSPLQASQRARGFQRTAEKFHGWRHHH